MHYHKEGYKIILVSTILVIVLEAILFKFLSELPVLMYLLASGALVFLFLIIQFFRVPHRDITIDDQFVLSPCDGKVVVIEEVEEKEYFNERRIQVSIFMSPLNVHVTYYPIEGKISYYKYHPGKFLVAWHPKSSTDNERTTIVVKSEKKIEVLFRQIAGAVARRIICYAKVGENVGQTEEAGFIKFGSRIDLFLPLDSKILVKLNDKVSGQISKIAEF